MNIGGSRVRAHGRGTEVSFIPGVFSVRANGIVTLLAVGISKEKLYRERERVIISRRETYDFKGSRTRDKEIKR